MSNLMLDDSAARYMKFHEAAVTGDFPNLLRSDYRDILLSAYGSVPQSLFNLCYVFDSNNQIETWRGLKSLAPTTDVVAEGQEFPERMLGEKSTVSITNYKYGDIVSYSREMLLYNKLSEFKRLAEIQGQQLALGLEENIADIIETSGNYTAYGSTILLNRANLELMINKFVTQTTTSASGKTVRLGLRPDTLLVPPDLEFEARRLLQSQQIPGSANNDINVLQGSLKLVVSHCMASTSIFFVMASKSPVGLTYQKVIGPPPETFTQDVKGEQMPDSSFRFDKISYRADMIYGLGVLDAKTILKSGAS